MDKILYVEDNEINAMVLEAMFKNDFIIDIAQTPEQALRYLSAYSYPCILMDINLGREEMDGIQLSKYIWRNLGMPEAKIIAVTAYAMEEDRTAFLDHGFFDYHPKPVNKESLQRSIRRALQTSLIRSGRR